MKRQNYYDDSCIKAMLRQIIKSSLNRVVLFFCHRHLVKLSSTLTIYKQSPINMIERNISIWYWVSISKKKIHTFNMKTNAIFDVAFEFDDSCSIKVKITFYFKMKNSICSLFYVLCITMCYLEAVPSYQNFALKNYIKIDVISKFNENVFQMFLVYILYDDNVTRTGSMLIDGIQSSADSRMTCQFHLTSGIREKTNIHEHCFERSLEIKFKYTGKKQESMLTFSRGPGFNLCPVYRSELFADQILPEKLGKNQQFNLRKEICEV